MRILEDTFVILHIRISNVGIGPIKGRDAFTLILCFLLAFGIIDLLKLTQGNFGVLEFLLSLFYILLILYGILFWIKAWPKANKLINKAIEREERYRKK